MTEEAKAELKPKKLHEILPALADGRIVAMERRLAVLKPLHRRELLQSQWTRILGDVTPKQTSIAGDRAKTFPAAICAVWNFPWNPVGPPVVPFLLLTPTAGKADDIRWPVVVMVAASGKASFLKSAATKSQAS